MSPAEDIAMLFGTPVLGGTAVIIAQSEMIPAAPTALWLIGALVLAIIGMWKWMMRREDAREAAKEARDLVRDAQMVKQTAELAKQTDIAGQHLQVLRDLALKQDRSDENRYHATRMVSDKLDALPEKIEHRLRSKKDHEET